MVKARTSILGVASQFATGTYTGDGNATQAIIGVGFQPVHVMAYRQIDAFVNSPGFKVRPIDGLSALVARLTAGIYEYDIDQIISLDADGFTVGDGSFTPGAMALNVLNEVYTYIAWG